MFFEALAKMSPDDIRRMIARRVSHSRVSESKHKKRISTLAQAAAQADAMQLDVDRLAGELALLEIGHDAKNNSWFEGLLQVLQRQWQHS